MRIFALSFLVGAFLAIAVESQAEDETLPLPTITSDATSSTQHYSVSREEMMRAARVERAKYVAAQHLAVTTLNRWNGINPARPQVNAGYMYSAPPRYTYRWFGPAQPTYVYPYGLPLP